MSNNADYENDNPQDDDPLEELIEDLREKADEAGKVAEDRKEETDLSGVDPSHMALAEAQGMRQAYQAAWNLAISKREDPPEEP